jgi:hypothetical protein
MKKDPRASIKVTRVSVPIGDGGNPSLSGEENFHLSQSDLSFRLPPEATTFVNPFSFFFRRGFALTEKNLFLF